MGDDVNLAARSAAWKGRVVEFQHVPWSESAVPMMEKKKMVA
jgi:hypothetical protein